MYPTPYTVQHASMTVVGENALGQAITEQVVKERPVYGWRVASTDDGGTAALAGRVTTEVMLLTPEDGWADGDVVTLPGGRGDYTVVGGVEDCNTGPFAPGLLFGYRVRLRKVHDGPA